MENLIYSYYDRESGHQTYVTKKLSELIKYIEEFPETGEETNGIVYQGRRPILEYFYDETGLTWQDVDTGLELLDEEFYNQLKEKEDLV